MLNLKAIHNKSNALKCVLRAFYTKEFVKLVLVCAALFVFANRTNGFKIIKRAVAINRA